MTQRRQRQPNHVILRAAQNPCIKRSRQRPEVYGRVLGGHMLRVPAAPARRGDLAAGCQDWWRQNDNQPSP